LDKKYRHRKTYDSRVQSQPGGGDTDVVHVLIWDTAALKIQSVFRGNSSRQQIERVLMQHMMGEVQRTTSIRLDGFFNGELATGLVAGLSTGREASSDDYLEVHSRHNWVEDLLSITLAPCKQSGCFLSFVVDDSRQQDPSIPSTYLPIYQKLALSLYPLSY
jgi:hypothetical protein